LFQSFILYQAKIKSEFERLSERHGFLALDGEASVVSVNTDLRKRIAAHLGIQHTHYRPSAALAPLWR
jgi:hypothetical protein